MPAGVERMAATDAPNSFCGPFDRAVFLNRADEVGTACWMESALGPEQRTDEFLVNAHQADQYVSWQLNDLF